MGIKKKDFKIGQSLGRKKILKDKFEMAEKSDFLNTTSETAEKEKSSLTSTFTVSVSSLKENPYNPRFFYQQDKIDELSGSLLKHGMLQPITVLEDSNGSFVVIDGHYRWKAAESINMTKIPCHLKKANSSEMFLIGREINSTRNEQTVFDDAIAFAKILKQGVFKSQSELALKIQKDRVYVTKVMQLNNLPVASMSEIIKYGKGRYLSYGYAILTLMNKMNNEQKFLEKLSFILKSNWSRSQIELFTRRLNVTEKKTPSAKPFVFKNKEGVKKGELKIVDDAVQMKLGGISPLVSSRIKSFIEFEILNMNEEVQK